MSNKTRKHIWPMSLVMAIAVVGGLAAFLVAGNPGATEAHRGGDDHAAACAAMNSDQRAIHNTLAGAAGGTPCAEPGDTSGVDMMEMEAGPRATTSSSTSASANVEIKLVIEELPMNVDIGGSIVLYLEDDFAEPDSISAGDVYFVSLPRKKVTGNGGRVYATVDPVISNDAYFDPDKDDIAIQVFVPDMCSNATTECEGDDGLKVGDEITMVVTKAAGINNPPEEGNHSTGYNVLPSTHTYELTITGSGFNDGTTASAYVLKAESAPADCAAIVADPASTLIGSGLVGSDDKVVITAEVTVPTFGAGNVNQICMVDGENRYSSDIDDFKLEPSIRVVPSTVSSGDTINVFAQDYPGGGGICRAEVGRAGGVYPSRRRDRQCGCGQGYLFDRWRSHGDLRRARQRGRQALAGHRARGRHVGHDHRGRQDHGGRL